MIETPSIQWFPGHMTKTKRMIKASLPLVDAVVELTDARIPMSSRNPDLASLIEGKPRIVLLNKCDSADEKATQKWLEYYKRNGVIAVAADCRTGRGLNKFVPAVREALADMIRRNEEKVCRAECFTLWWWAYPMWESPHSSTVWQEAKRQRSRTVPVLPVKSSG